MEAQHYSLSKLQYKLLQKAKTNKRTRDIKKMNNDTLENDFDPSFLPSLPRYPPYQGSSGYNSYSLLASKSLSFVTSSAWKQET